MADDSGAAGARATRKQRSQRRGRTFYCGVPEENGAGRHTLHVRLADRCGNLAAILILTLMAGREKDGSRIISYATALRVSDQGKTLVGKSERCDATVRGLWLRTMDE
ncbi:hypothetical protein [Herbaspirillum rubrisubalbicans]|uniref:hypothetical protein n=2 Tax=Oxalobacteraceae TaxID=75682 RepID=UPI00034845EC|nr:hypothetical protein [Herbaspirillum rubrisubalbicans]MCP1575317.1 hypothetical protein [Herbaspirillum rubrisubalbicans]